MGKRLTDRPMITALIEKHIAEEDRPSAIQVAERVVRDLYELDAKGDFQARRALMELPLPSLIQLAGQQLRNRDHVGVGWNGTHVSVPARLAVEVRDENGAPTGEKQYPLWVYESWDEVQALRDRLAAQRDGIAATVKAIEQVLRLHERYPDAKTPFDACELAGINPDDIRVAA